MFDRPAFGFIALILALPGCGTAPPAPAASTVVIAPPLASAAAAPPSEGAPPRSACFLGEWCSEPLPAGVEGPIKGLWGTGPNDVYAVGDGAILHHDGHAWKREAVDFATPDDGLTAVWGSSATDVWAASFQGNLYRREGGRWALKRRGDDWLRAIWGTGPNNIYVVGGATDSSKKEGVLLHFDGAAWTREVVAGHPLMAIAGRGPNDWIAAGWGETIVVGGASGRKLITTPQSHNFMAAWAQGDRLLLGDWTEGVYRQRDADFHLDLLRAEDGASGLWGTGDELYGVNWGRISHFDGKTWTMVQFTDKDARELYAVWGAAGHVFVAGTGTTILHKWPRAAGSL